MRGSFCSTKPNGTWLLRSIGALHVDTWGDEFVPPPPHQSFACDCFIAGRSPQDLVTLISALLYGDWPDLQSVVCQTLELYSPAAHSPQVPLILPAGWYSMHLERLCSHECCPWSTKSSNFEVWLRDTCFLD